MFHRAILDSRLRDQEELDFRTNAQPPISTIHAAIRRGEGPAVSHFELLGCFASKLPANGLASLVNLILLELCTHRPHKHSRASVWPNFGVAAPNQAFLPSSIISKSSAGLTMDSGAIANSADFLVILFLVCDNRHDLLVQRAGIVLE